MVIYIARIVDNYVDKMWITLLCVRVVRTVLLFCLCTADSMCLCVTDKIDDGIVFDVWCVVTTLYMFLCVYLGLVTTLCVKMG